MAAAIGMGLASLLLWLILFIRSRSFYRLYYQIPTESTIVKPEKIDQLKTNLAELGSAHGATQILKLQEKLYSLNEVLKKRFDSGELTFDRYFNTARQVYLSAIKNWQDVEVALRSVNTIDVAYINNRINELRSNPELFNEQIREIRVLKENLDEFWRLEYNNGTINFKEIKSS